MELQPTQENFKRSFKHFSLLIGGVLIGLALKSPLTNSREKFTSSIQTDTTKALFDSTAYKEGWSDGHRIGLFEGGQQVYNGIYDKHRETIDSLDSRDSINLSKQSQPENNQNK